MLKRETEKKFLEQRFQCLETAVADATRTLIRNINIEWEKIKKCSEIKQSQHEKVSSFKDRVQYFIERKNHAEHNLSGANQRIEYLKKSSEDLKKTFFNIRREEEKIAKKYTKEKETLGDKLVFFKEKWKQRYETRYANKPMVQDYENVRMLQAEASEQLKILKSDLRECQADIFKAKCERGKRNAEENGYYPLEAFIIRVARMGLEVISAEQEEMNLQRNIKHLEDNITTKNTQLIQAKAKITRPKDPKTKTDQCNLLKSRNALNPYMIEKSYLDRTPRTNVTETRNTLHERNSVEPLGARNTTAIKTFISSRNADRNVRNRLDRLKLYTPTMNTPFFQNPLSIEMEKLPLQPSLHASHQEPFTNTTRFNNNKPHTVLQTDSLFFSENLTNIQKQDHLKLNVNKSGSVTEKRTDIIESTEQLRAKFNVLENFKKSEKNTEKVSSFTSESYKNGPKLKEVIEVQSFQEKGLISLENKSFTYSMNLPEQDSHAQILDTPHSAKNVKKRDLSMVNTTDNLKPEKRQLQKDVRSELVDLCNVSHEIKINASQSAFIHLKSDADFTKDYNITKIQERLIRNGDETVGKIGTLYSTVPEHIEIFGNNKKPNNEKLISQLVQMKERQEEKTTHSSDQKYLNIMDTSEENTVFLKQNESQDILFTETIDVFSDIEMKSPKNTEKLNEINVEKTKPMNVCSSPKQNHVRDTIFVPSIEKNATYEIIRCGLQAEITPTFKIHNVEPEPNTTTNLAVPKIISPFFKKQSVEATGVKKKILHEKQDAMEVDEKEIITTTRNAELNNPFETKIQETTHNLEVTNDLQQYPMPEKMGTEVTQDDIDNKVDDESFKCTSRMRPTCSGENQLQTPTEYSETNSIVTSPVSPIIRSTQQTSPRTKIHVNSARSPFDFEKHVKALQELKQSPDFTYQSRLMYGQNQPAAELQDMTHVQDQNRVDLPFNTMSYFSPPTPMPVTSPNPSEPAKSKSDVSEFLSFAFEDYLADSPSPTKDGCKEKSMFSFGNDSPKSKDRSPTGFFPLFGADTEESCKEEKSGFSFQFGGGGAAKSPEKNSGFKFLF